MEGLESIFTFIKSAGLFVGGIVALLIFLVYIFQDKILYLPVIQGLPLKPQENPVGYRNPMDRGLKYSDIHITTSDSLRLHGWILKQEKATEVPTIVYFHENAGNIGTRVFYMEEYFKQGYNVVLIAYRGYSNSEGKPSERGLQLDGEAILKHMFNRQDIDTKQIYLHGRSLGGAVAIYLASQMQNQYQLAGLIAEITFTSIDDMVDVVFPQLSYQFLKNLLITNHWKSIDRIGSIKVPIHFIFAMKDELVPAKHMAILYEKATSAKFKSMHQVQDGSHNNNWQVDPFSYFESIKTFINQCQEQKQ